jgi:hypothetical protein
MGDKYYAHEKFCSAVRHLAISDGSRRDHLLEAHRCFVGVSDTDMPTEEVAEEFRALTKRLTWAEDTNGQGTIPATLAVIDDGEARAIASAIVDIRSALEHSIIDAQKNGERWGAHHELTSDNS